MKKRHFYIVRAKGGGITSAKLTEDEIKWHLGSCAVVDGPFDCPVMAAKMLHFWIQKLSVSYRNVGLTSWGTKPSAWLAGGDKKH